VSKEAVASDVIEPDTNLTEGNDKYLLVTTKDLQMSRSVTWVTPKVFRPGSSKGRSSSLSILL
jgi:hypothetical protein